MRVANTIVLATTNRHKFEEFETLFKKHPELKIAPVQDFIRNSEKLGLVEISDQYIENAQSKARACNHGCHYPSLADDSGLEVMALEGRPGVFSHRYAIPKTGQTQDQANMIKLLDEMKNIPVAQRNARFVCHLAFVMEGTIFHSLGILDGTISFEPRGVEGFGYDPIFIPKGFDKTLAEMSPAQKNKISHRSLAVDQLMLELLTKEIVIARP
jgi:XTP/dITP diphosphohydrolase